MKRLARLTDALAPGQRVLLPTLSSESALLAQELKADPRRAAGVTFSGVQFPGIDTLDVPALHPQARLEAFFMSPAVRRGLASGQARLMPMDYAALARYFTHGPACDLVIAHLTPPDAEGYCDFGVTGDFMPLAWTRAHRRIAHLNPQLPRIAASRRVHVDELDGVVEQDAPLVDFAEAVAGPVEQAIGRHVGALVRDGDTVQFGVGAVPAAVVASLTAHRRLRFHGGMASAAVGALWDSGALDRDAPLVTGVLLGNATFRTRAEQDWAASSGRLVLRDVETTHGLGVLARIPRLVAINSAVEVDLFGQVNAERMNGAQLAGAGGLPAFAAGALASPGGQLVIALPASARGGSVSRIVPAIGEQGLVTLPRHMADIVVTEHGVASLRGLDLDARAQALIAVAAPAHRDSLSAAWDRIRSST